MSKSSTLLLVPTVLAAVATLAAQDAPSALDQRLNDLEQEIKILKRKGEISAEEAATKAKTSVSTTANDKDGFSLKAADGSWKIRFTGLLATDGRFFLNDEELKNNPNQDPNSQFLVRYFRPSLQVSLGKNVDAVLVPDFAGGTAQIVDGFVDFKHIPYATLRAGKFVQPLGLERWQSTPALTFPERSLASNLTANRDVGLQASGETTDGFLGYAIGVFNGSPDNVTRDGEDNTNTPRNNDGKDGVGRLTIKPFATAFNDALNGLELSFSASYGDEGASVGNTAGANLPTKYVSFGQNTIFAYNAGIYANGHRTRLNPQLKWYYDQFSVLSEYVAESQELQGSTGATSVAHKAWFASAGVVLTGEKSGWKGVTPATEFDPLNGGWGAFELVARVDQLDLDDNAFDKKNLSADPTKSVSKATAYGLSANWYWSKNVRVTGSYERTDFEGGASNGLTATANNYVNVIDRQTEHAFISRIQVAF